MKEWPKYIEWLSKHLWTWLHERVIFEIQKVSFYISHLLYSLGTDAPPTFCSNLLSVSGIQWEEGEELKQPRPRINSRIIDFKDAYLLLWNHSLGSDGWVLFPPLCCSLWGAKVDDIQPDTSLTVKQLWSRFHILFIWQQLVCLVSPAAE